MHPEDESEFDIRHILMALRRRAWIVVACTLLAVTVALGISVLSTPLYASTAQVRIVDPSAEAVSSSGPVRVDREREVETQVQIIKSRELREAVEDAVGAEPGAIESVSVQALGISDVIAIRVVSSSPETAQAAANAYAELYVEKRRNDVTAVFEERADRLRRGAEDIQKRISEVNIELSEGPPPLEEQQLQAERDALVVQQAEMQRQAGELEVQAATRSGNVAIVQRGQLPSAPFAPNTERTVILFGLLGLIVGIGLALLVDRLDDRVSALNHADVLGVPLLGMIPQFGRRSRLARRRDAQRELVDPSTPAAEAFRTLATSVRFSAVGRDLRIFAVTSAERGEGKSTVVANLAVALAEMGKNIIVVSADLRAPVQGQIFHLDESVNGLTSVLLGDAPLLECFRQIPLRSRRSLYVLPAGPAPQNPHELLSSDRMAEVINVLTGTGADFVIVDCPPVLPVGDTLALAHMVDGILVVASAGMTRRGAFIEAVDRLRAVDGNVIGAILNRSESESRYGSRYGEYGYPMRPPAGRAPEPSGVDEDEAVEPVDELAGPVKPVSG